jgi:hypothetical protein
MLQANRTANLGRRERPPRSDSDGRNTLAASKCSRRFPNHMDSHIWRDGGELLFQTDEIDNGAVRLEPSCATMRLPLLLPSGSVGEIEVGAKEVLDWIAHGHQKGGTGVIAATPLKIAKMRSCQARLCCPQPIL